MRGAEPDSRPVSPSLILVLVRDAGRVATMEMSPEEKEDKKSPTPAGLRFQQRALSGIRAQADKLH